MKSFYVGAKGIVLYQDSILLLKRLRNDTYFWDPPGGRVDEGEELEAALRRELSEEIGVRNATVHEKLTFYKVPQNVEKKHGLVLVYYKVSIDTNLIVISEEHDDYIWVNKSEVKDFLKKERDHIHEGTVEAIQKCTI